MKPALELPLGREITVDAFAGGGGASTGIEQAYAELGLDPIEIAVNHDEDALQMHAANHPETLHVREDVFKADMRKLVGRRLVRLLWLSPDCKHFSKAKGGKPVEKRIRGLAWIAVKWGAQLKPRVIILENVEEFQEWGPLVFRDGAWYPDPERKGLTFKRFLGRLRAQGYRIEHRQLRGKDHGAPTVRRRLFLVCRRDAEPIVWPQPSHGKGTAKAYRTAAECIDFGIPVCSIFATREEAKAWAKLHGTGVPQRPLKENTMRRIGRGTWRYVINAAEPFIVPVTQTSDQRVHPIGEPLRTITTAKGGEFALCVPTLINTRNGERIGQAPRVRDIREPYATVSAAGSQGALVMAFLAQHNTGMVGHDLRVPLSTIVGKGSTQQLVTSHLVKLKGTCKDGHPLTEPMATIQAGGWHLGEVRAFLSKYYGTEQDPRLEEPLHTVPTRARLGLVYVRGEAYEIVDIGMRMLTPRELARAQGFPDSYVIDRGADGRKLSKATQIRMIGNSVCPPVAKALVLAQFAGEMQARRAA